MKIIDIKRSSQESALWERNSKELRAIDVRDKMVFIKAPGSIIDKYVGRREWEECRKHGARSVIFIPDHMEIVGFTDEDLMTIGLQRIPQQPKEEKKLSIT